MAWGAGTQKITDTHKHYEIFRFYAFGWETQARKRLITITEEIWVGMSDAAADAKVTALIADTTYTNVHKRLSAGGERQVTGTKKTEAAWSCWYSDTAFDPYTP